MDKSLLTLCHALKTTAKQLRANNNALSFILLTGKGQQGKSALLRQSHFQHIIVEAERTADIYYNDQGIILELSESWINQSNSLLQYSLRKLNSCHSALKISGLALCIDIHDLFISDPDAFASRCKAHLQLLQRFGQSLGKPIDLALIFTKMDALAGFSEFFHNDHQEDLNKALGFSLIPTTDPAKLQENYKQQFDHLLEMLSQQVITKIHPARSSIKRTLVREFPLQLATLKAAIQVLLLKIPRRLFHLEALYFTSAEQGGMSQDRLNKKIQQEYALVLQDKYPQSNNYRAYFIQGAFLAFQKQTRRQIQPITVPYKWTLAGLSMLLSLSFTVLLYQHFHSSNLLDEASKELLLYEAMGEQDQKKAPALYHLAKASTALQKISTDISMPTIQYVKTQLKVNTAQTLQGDFLPSLLAELEQSMMDAGQSQAARYQALKIYLTLDDPSRFSEASLEKWFLHQWQQDPKEQVQHKLALLRQVLKAPLQSKQINQQVVTDLRNYLNALPSNYLFYALAKSQFPEKTQPIAVEGFDLAHKEIPYYLTKKGFPEVLKQIPDISAKLKAENWVLARQDLDNLPSILQQAYCYEYVAWWQSFMTRSRPIHFQDYQQARHLTETLQKTNAVKQLIDIIQNETSPELTENNSLFNQEIASKFTFLSLLSQSSVQDLTLNLTELDKFLTSLSLVQDQGQTAYTLTKARFQGDTLANPLSSLYNKSAQMPSPVSTWIKQIADDTWFILIHDSREFINHQWQQRVYLEYQNQIAQRYPFDANQSQDVAIADFDHFFASHGVFNRFMDEYLKPFMDTSHAQWQPKEVNGYVLPISAEAMNELIRANVISNMFFPEQAEHSKIEFSLQKLSLDPIVASMQLSLGNKKIADDQNSDSQVRFDWPSSNAKLVLNSIEGNHYELEETGPWAFFKILQKVNVLVDEQDSSSLQILFEVNGNSGRYILKAQNRVNPFIPGILNGFVLKDTIV